MARKTASEQVMNTDKQPHVVSPLPHGFPGSTYANSMVVSTPAEVNDLLRQVPEGRLTTLDHVRQHLAHRYGTDIACPVSTAIFLNISARAAEEQASQGQSGITPYWRALKTGGYLNPKFPNGVEAQKAKLEAEGFTVVNTRKGYMVQDYSEFLMAWDES